MINSKLKDINFGLNEYCGPSVLSALTGKSTDECAAVIAGINGSQQIKAVNMKDLIAALEKLRYDVIKQKVNSYSLYGTLTHLAHKPGLYIITVPKHYIAVEVVDKKIFLIDNHSRQAIDAASSARLSQRVDDVYEVIARKEPKFICSEINIEKKYSGNIYLKVVDKYEDERDNVTISIGHIYYRNLGELELIINELAKIGETK